MHFDPTDVAVTEAGTERDPQHDATNQSEQSKPTWDGHENHSDTDGDTGHDTVPDGHYQGLLRLIEQKKKGLSVIATVVICLTAFGFVGWPTISSIEFAVSENDESATSGDWGGGGSSAGGGFGPPVNGGEGGGDVGGPGGECCGENTNLPQRIVLDGPGLAGTCTDGDAFHPSFWQTGERGPVTTLSSIHRICGQRTTVWNGHTIRINWLDIYNPTHVYTDCELTDRGHICWLALSAG